MGLWEDKLITPSHTTSVKVWTQIWRAPALLCPVLHLKTPNLMLCGQYYLDETLKSGALTRTQWCMSLEKGDMLSSIWRTAGYDREVRICCCRMRKWKFQEIRLCLHEKSCRSELLQVLNRVLGCPESFPKMEACFCIMLYFLVCCSFILECLVNSYSSFKT